MMFFLPTYFLLNTYLINTLFFIYLQRQHNQVCIWNEIFIILKNNRYLAALFPTLS